MSDIEIRRLREDVETLTDEVNKLKSLVRKMKELNSLRGLTTEDVDFLRTGGD